MKQYLGLLNDVLEHGEERDDRTGTGTLSVFGRQVHYDLKKGFPCLTTKKLHLRSIIYELLWFLRGDTNVKYLKENGVSIWDEWAHTATGELGPIYGRQWRSYPKPNGGHIDQISQLVQDLKHSPNSRRHLVVAWNPGELEEMALPPCHCLFQFFVHNATDGQKRSLSCQLYQRSADLFLGVPFNIASYALLTHLIAQACGYQANSFIHTFGDLHLYKNHLKQAQLQLTRRPYPLPQLTLNPTITDLFSFSYEDIKLEGYQTHPAIKAPVSV